MTTKKVVLVVGGVLAGFVLLLALFVGAIAGAVFYTINNSEAAQTAKQFLRRNEKLKAEIGEVRDFGLFTRGHINAERSDGSATLYLKVKGARRSVDAKVDLIYRHGRAWHVTGASYKNEAGRTIELFDAFEMPDDSPATEGAGDEGRGSQMPPAEKYR